MIKRHIRHARVTILLLFTVLIIQHSSCKKWLDIKVDKTQTVPANLEDFQAMLNDYGPINTSSSIVLREVASDGHYYADNIWTSMQGTKFKNAYTWTNDPVYNNLTDWQVPYAVVLRMNIILSEAAKLDENANPGLRDIKGQALFNRSRMFYELSQTFSPPYTPQTENAPYGIPLRIEPDIKQPTVRSTVGETYKQIIEDLIQASSLLNERSDFVTRASKLASYGLLSRVYLSMNKFDSAHKYADKYLSISNSLMNFSELSTTTNFIGINTEVAFVNFFTSISNLNNNYLIEQELFNSYQDDDLRKKIFFKVSGGLIRFKGSYSKASNDIFAGIATDEIYLIRAECKVRKGDIPGGLKDLNDLIRTRYRVENGMSTYIDQTSNNEVEALKIIFMERRKELILRNLRWTDLRRLNQDSRFETTLTRNAGGETFTLPPNSYMYTFPIPNDIIQQTGISQNPGWEK